MKAPRKKVILVTILGCFAMFMVLDSPLLPWLSLKNFARQVKAHVDPMELQQWATNLMSQYYSQTFLEYHGEKFFQDTNIPAGLKKVGIYQNGINLIVEGSDASVAIFGDSKGGPFLVLESPSFARTNQTVIVWKPGIRFVGEPLDWR